MCDTNKKKSTAHSEPIERYKNDDLIFLEKSFILKKLSKYVFKTPKTLF
jgi:hypothetical protein